MKLIKILIVLVFFVFGLRFTPQIVVGTTSTLSGQTASQSGVSDRAKEILDKITDKVSQIGTNLKKSYTGKVRSLGNNNISLTYDSGEIFAETNDATNFYKFRSGIRTSSEFKNLKIGSELTIIGILDEGNHTLIARQVIDKIRRYSYFGHVNSINKSVLTISVNGTEKTIDLSSATSIKKVGSKNDLVVGKINDISIGDFAGAIGFFEDDNPNLQALKLLYIPQTVFTLPTPTPVASPSAKPKI